MANFNYTLEDYLAMMDYVEDRLVGDPRFNMPAFHEVYDFMETRKFTKWLKPNKSV